MSGKFCRTTYQVQYNMIEKISTTIPTCLVFLVQKKVAGALSWIPATYRRRS
jgi:hypothetical protein